MESGTLLMYNACNEPAGQASRSQVHQKGPWHRLVNYPVLNPKKRTLIFQDSAILDQYTKEVFIRMNGGHLSGDDMVVFWRVSGFFFIYFVANM